MSESMEIFNGVSSAETGKEKTMKDKDSILVNSISPPAGKVRRRRTVYSRRHLELLLNTFETNPYPGIALREKLSQLTGIHESRIQVWFQNRRARKNKKTIQEEDENQSQDLEGLQFNQIPQVQQIRQPEIKQSGMEYIQKHEDICKTPGLPMQTLSNLPMNSLAGYMWSNQCQPNVAATPHFLNSIGITQQHVHSFMNPQPFYSYTLPHAASPLESDCSGHSSSSFLATEPDQCALKELSLQDVLEEFQPSWAEEANNPFDVNDVLLF
ncbi:uncharacterized protein [Pyxicephalus adspersus]|uniref:uncharacterized protein n=1 Tax=Pyxicephalus adspersus TaxID=30357 RepID=UPI003B5B168F